MVDIPGINPVTPEGYYNINNLARHLVQVRNPELSKNRRSGKTYRLKKRMIEALEDRGYRVVKRFGTSKVYPVGTQVSWQCDKEGLAYLLSRFQFSDPDIQLAVKQYLQTLGRQISNRYRDS